MGTRLNEIFFLFLFSFRFSFFGGGPRGVVSPGGAAPHFFFAKCLIFFHVPYTVVPLATTAPCWSAFSPPCAFKCWNRICLRLSHRRSLQTCSQFQLFKLIYLFYLQDKRFLRSRQHTARMGRLIRV